MGGRPDNIKSPGGGNKLSSKNVCNEKMIDEQKIEFLCNTFMKDDVVNDPLVFLINRLEVVNFCLK